MDYEGHLHDIVCVLPLYTDEPAPAPVPAAPPSPEAAGPSQGPVAKDTGEVDLDKRTPGVFRGGKRNRDDYYGSRYGNVETASSPKFYPSPQY